MEVFDFWVNFLCKVSVGTAIDLVCLVGQASVVSGSRRPSNANHTGGVCFVVLDGIGGG